MAYSVDTSIFIRFDKYYPESENPKLWDFLRKMIQEKKFVISKEVIFELEVKNQNFNWIKNDYPDSIIETEEDVQVALTQLLANYSEWAKATLTRTIADHFVVALAKARSYNVLSNEKVNKKRLSTFNASMVTKNVKIPEICYLENIPHYDLPQILADIFI